MIIWRPLLPIFLLALNPISSTEIFDPFFSHGTTFFSPQAENPFGNFPGYSFGPSTGVQLPPNYQTPYAAETSNIPIYTDGVPTPPQATLSRLEKDYNKQLHHLANSRPGPTVRSNPTSRPRPRYPKFRSEPYPSASNIDERNPTGGPVNKQQQTTEGPRFIGPKSQPIEIHTGFVPIIKGVTQEQRANRDISSTVIKDIEPPILTAAPNSLTARPNLLTVSASVQSSSKISPNGQRISNSDDLDEVNPRSRQSSYSRYLHFPNDTRASAGPSESISSRGATHPESILDLQQKELFRLSPSESVIFEENKVAAREILDLNCEGSQDLGWCELGDNYPREYVNQVVSSCPDVVERMYVEVPHSFEKLSDTSDFKAELDNSSYRSAKERSSHDAWSWAAYFHQGSLCDAETGFLRPETARDTSGQWNIIVQSEDMKQRVPIEMCRKTNGSCKKMLNCGLKSQCLQKYNYHSLLSLNPSQNLNDCPFIKLYRFPSACVCHVE